MPNLFVSGPKFTQSFSSNVGEIVVINAVFRLSTRLSGSVSGIFAIEV